MIIKGVVGITLFIFLSSGLSNENEQQHLTWGDVSDVTLSVGVEQIIETEPLSNLDVGLPSEVSDKLELLNAGGRIFLTASEAFDNVKLILRHNERGSTIINLSASDSALQQNYTLNIPTQPLPQTIIQETYSCPSNYVEITRWALQQIYAPERILKDENCFSRSRVASTTLDIFICERTMLCGGGVSATPMVSWKSANNLFIHMITIKNNRTQKIVLDARDVAYSREMLAITFAHGWLDTAGSVADNTIAVLITSTKLEDTPFAYSES